MLGDLGLGKALDVSSRLTMIAGTPAFVAPEQAQGETPDARADQYSLAVITYLLLTGRRPWDHATLPAAAAPGPPPPMSTPRLATSRRRSSRSWCAPCPSTARSASPRSRPTSTRSPVPSPAWTEMGPDGVVGHPGAARGPAADPAGRPPLAVPHDRRLAGASLSRAPGAAAAGPSRARRRSRRLAVGVAALVALAAGGVGGYVVEQETEPAPPTTPVELEDATGTLGVTVPRSLDAEAPSQWKPPNAKDQDFPALSVGTSARWTGGRGRRLPRPPPGQ